MTTPYLSGAVGVPLTQCLCELTERCPRDPIEWIAQWLYRYIDKELYFYEKAIFLKDLHRMRLELDKENQSRQHVVNAMNANIYEMKKQAREDENAMADLMLKKLASTSVDGEGEGGGRRRRGRRGRDGMSRAWGEGSSDAFYASEEEELTEYERQRRAMKKLAKEMGMRPSEMTEEFLALHPEFQDRLADLKASDLKNLGRMSTRSGRRGKGAGGRDWDSYSETVEGRKRQKEIQRMVATCTWCLDCDMGLVCNHSILGRLRARCAIVKYDTPQWWQTKGFALENLYDHEIYTTTFSNKYAQSASSVESVALSGTSDNSRLPSTV